MLRINIENAGRFLSHQGNFNETAKFIIEHADAIAMLEADRGDRLAPVQGPPGIHPADGAHCYECRIARMPVAAAPVQGEARPDEMAVALIGRCPGCGEFPERWSSLGVRCSECGAELICNFKHKDGAEHWTFDFALEGDFLAHRAATQPPAPPVGTGGRQPLVTDLSTVCEHDRFRANCDKCARRTPTQTDGADKP